MSKRILVNAAAAVIWCLAIASPTLASRAPTRVERGSIVKAVRAGMKGVPTSCYSIAVKVSTVKPPYGRYALATPQWPTSGTCVKYAANGFDILRLIQGRWVVIYTGSDPPRCSHIPLPVTRDLLHLACMPG